MKKYKYMISYDEDKDEFYAWIVNTEDEDDDLFLIESTEEMCSLIKNNIMNHIDDVDGLAQYLKDQMIMKSEDELLISEVVLW